MKRSPYNNPGKWESWKQNNFDKSPKGIRNEDWKLLIEFLNDMELGLNTPKGTKGKRDSGTLLNLSSHNKFFLEQFNKPLVKLSKLDLHKLDNDVREGKILKSNKKPFLAFGNYIKDFKVFWNWMVRTHRVKENITEDISAKTDKPFWVFLKEEQIKNFFNRLSLDYRTICWFMYDTGMRVTEANSIKVSDFSEDFKQVTIPDEVAKTFGRTINLKLCSDLVRDFVKSNNLKPDDYLLRKKPFSINKYLKFHCGKIFGKDNVSHPKSKGKYGEFTLYDIRHNSACYWFNRYPTHKGLMYRFGWRKADKIEYYSDFLGVTDEIKDEDMIVGVDKTQMEKKILEQERELEAIKKTLSLVLKKGKPHLNALLERI